MKLNCAFIIVVSDPKCFIYDKTCFDFVDLVILRDSDKLVVISLRGATMFHTFSQNN
jgi:hypothetical protein